MLNANRYEPFKGWGACLFAFLCFCFQKTFLVLLRPGRKAFIIKMML